MAHVTAQFFGSPPPGALGRGQKVKYHEISITQSISNIFKPNFVCLLTNERYKTYQTGFSFDRLGHAPGVDLGVRWGLGVIFLKFNQSWCVSYLHEWHMQQHNCFGPPPLGALGRGQRSNIIKSQLLSQFQIFLNQTLCLLTKERYKTYLTGFHWVPWVMPNG